MDFREVVKKRKSIRVFTNLLPIATLPLGYPAENPSRHTRKSLSEIRK